jgi:pimeloyl-ACP methyl ester carboxylesterase
MTLLASSPPVVRRWFNANGLRLHALDFGGDGPLLVCLHGVTGNAAAWSGVAASATSWGRVLALDLRGFGDSEWSAEDDYATTTMAADVAAVLEALGERAILVGSSWGGLIALATASARPDLVRGLAMVDIEPSFTQAPDDVPPRPRHFADHTEVVAYERMANPHAPAPLLEVIAASATRPAADGGLVPKYDPCFFERWDFRSDDWWPALDVLLQPLLVVRAGSSFVRAEVTEEMARRGRAPAPVVIDECTHVVPVDRPRELADALRAFVAGAAP